jgi:hypothetical protein
MRCTSSVRCVAIEMPSIFLRCDLESRPPVASSHPGPPTRLGSGCELIRGPFSPLRVASLMLNHITNRRPQCDVGMSRASSRAAGMQFLTYVNDQDGL